MNKYESQMKQNISTELLADPLIDNSWNDMPLPTFLQHRLKLRIPTELGYADVAVAVLERRRSCLAASLGQFDKGSGVTTGQ